MPPSNCAKQRPHFVRLAFGAAGGEAGGGGERRRAIGTAPAPATRSLWARAERGGASCAVPMAALRLRVVQGCANMGLCLVQPLCRAVWSVSLLAAACGFVTA